MNAAARGEGTSLAEQVRHKVQVVDAIRAMYPKQQGQESVKLVLVGHSIGSHICLEMLKARPDAIDGIHMLFPTIAHIGRTPNARNLRVSLAAGYDSLTERAQD